MHKSASDIFKLKEDILSHGTIGHGLVTERPPGWEYLLFTLALREGVLYAKSQRSSLESGLGLKASTFPVQSMSYASLLAKKRLNELHGLLYKISNIDSELQAALGEPGKSGDPDSLLDVAFKIIDYYINILLWRGGIAKIASYGQVIRYMDILGDVPCAQIMVIEEFCECGYERVQDYLGKRLSGQKVDDIHLSLSIPCLDLSSLELYDNPISTEKVANNAQVVDKGGFSLSFGKAILKQGCLGDDLVTKRPPGWQYLFFSWILKEGITYAKNRNDFLASQQELKPSTFPIQSMSYASIVAKQRLDELDAILSIINNIDTELQVIMGEPEKSSDPNLLLEAASKVIECYINIMLWRDRVLKIKVCEQLTRYMQILRDIPSAQIKIIEDFCETLYFNIDNHIKKRIPGENADDFFINLSVPTVDQYSLELYRLENANLLDMGVTEDAIGHSSSCNTNKATNCISHEYESDCLERDNFEKFNFYSSVPLDAIGNYRINYTDQRALNTIRDIRVKRVHKDNDSYAIDAHCMLRGAHRSFLDDRVNEAVNLDTGEIVYSVALDAIDQYKNSDEGKATLILDSEWDAIAVLLFVACADGRLMRAEKDIIQNYIKDRNPSFNAGGLKSDRYINRHIAASHTEFRKIINGLASSGESKKLEDIYFAAKSIVEIGSTIDPMERAALDIIDSALKKSLTQSPLKNNK
jgi:hypothetical protein